MKPLFLKYVTVLLLLCVLPVRPVSAFLLSFDNLSEFDREDVYVWFTGAAGYDLKITGQSQNIVLGTAYNLSDLSGGLEMERFVAGRVYFSLGAPLGTSGLKPDGTPLNNPGVLQGDIGYNVRHDFMELTYTPNPADVADLTSMDQFAIPLHLQLKKNGAALAGSNTSAGWKGHTDQQVVDALRPLSLSQSNIYTVNGEFVRANGATKFPALYQNSPGDARSMTAYLDHIKENQPARGPMIIKGQFSAEVAYEYSAALDDNGNYVLTKTGGATGNPQSIVVPSSYKSGPNEQDPMVSLALAIYLSNPWYSVDGGPVGPTQNDVAGAVARDLFAALNLGYVSSDHIVTASDTVDPGLIGKPIYELSTIQMRSLTVAFDDVGEFYNIYANEIRKLSDSYGYAYSDWNEHLSKVAVLLNGQHGGQFADELNIQIFGSKHVAVPEPSTWALLGMGAGAVCIAIIRKGRKIGARS